MSKDKLLCETHLQFYYDQCDICPAKRRTWKIKFEEATPESNYHGPDHAKILIRNNGETIWNCHGYLMLSANSGCKEALKELEKLVNQAELTKEK